MENYQILNRKFYNTVKRGISFTGNLVDIIGEQTVCIKDKILDQYLYNIKDYTPENNKPFVSLKSNIILEE